VLNYVVYNGLSSALLNSSNKHLLHFERPIWKAG